jgi:AcrR family transcriptional regulator
MTSESPARQVGRPRGTATDSRILKAVLDLVSEVGVSGVTVSEVARRAGVARATIYLRWPSRAELIGAATKATVGGRPFPLTGDIVRDIQVGTHFFRDIIAAPAFNALFPELAAEVLSAKPQVPWDALSPNRSKLAANYLDAAARQGLDPQVDPDLPYYLMVGGLLANLLVNGKAPSHAWTQQLVDVVVAGLKVSGTDAQDRPRG